MKETDEEHSEAMRGIATLGSAGFAAGLSLAIFVVGGHYADVWLGTKPIFTVAGILIGIFASFYMLIRSAFSSGRK